MDENNCTEDAEILESLVFGDFDEPFLVILGDFVLLSRLLPNLAKKLYLLSFSVNILAKENIMITQVIFEVQG